MTLRKVLKREGMSAQGDVTMAKFKGTGDEEIGTARCQRPWQGGG